MPPSGKAGDGLAAPSNHRGSGPHGRGWALDFHCKRSFNVLNGMRAVTQWQTFAIAPIRFSRTWLRPEITNPAVQSSATRSCDNVWIVSNAVCVSCYPQLPKAFFFLRHDTIPPRRTKHFSCGNITIWRGPCVTTRSAYSRRMLSFWTERAIVDASRGDRP
jgi:hypothetical protein